MSFDSFLFLLFFLFPWLRGRSLSLGSDLCLW